MIANSTKKSLFFAWAAAMFANGLNWLFNIYLNRQLDLHQYSMVGVVLNAFMFLSTFALAYQFSVIKFIPQIQKLPHSEQNRFSSTAFWLLIIPASFLSLLAYCEAPFWEKFLNLNLSPFLYLVISLSVFGIFISALVRGYLYGRLAYYLVGTVIVIESFLKLGITFFSSSYGSRLLNFSFVAICLSMLFYLIVLIYPIFTRYHQLLLVIDFSWVNKLLRFFTINYFTTISSQLFLFTDLIFVSHYLTSYEAGIYATVSLVGKMIFFFTTSIVALIAPEVSVKSAAQRRTSQVLYRSVLFTSVVGLLSTFFFHFFPQYSLKLFLDPVKVDLAHPYLMVYGLTITLISLVVVTSAYFVFASYRYLVWGTIIGLTIQLFLFTQFHQSIHQIQLVMLGSSIFTLVLSLCLVAVEKFYLSKKNSAVPGFKVSSSVKP